VPVVAAIHGDLVGYNISATRSHRGAAVIGAMREAGRDGARH
jgi:hypothetical protein